MSELEEEDDEDEVQVQVTSHLLQGTGNDPLSSAWTEHEIETVMDSSLDSGSGFFNAALGGGDGQSGVNVTGMITEVADKTFDEMHFPAEMIQEVQDTWSAFISSQSSREVASDMLYGALFDAAPSLQVLFKTPRAVMSGRIMNGINTIVNSLTNPLGLKINVESMGFQHLELEVTAPRVAMFRDAIIDLFEMELGDKLTNRGKMAFKSILNYVGGAFIYVRVNYADRLKIIASSWATANHKAATFDYQDELEEAKAAAAAAAEGGEEAEGEQAPVENAPKAENKEAAPAEDEKEAKPSRKGIEDTPPKSKKAKVAQQSGADDDEIAMGTGKRRGMKVPTTFTEMFMFNGAVMGFGESEWMAEILESFDTMVQNVSNSNRLQEECDTLSLRLAKYKGDINLAEFKAVMLASLRSMVPKEWDSAHEVAWTWLWSNVERMLKAEIGKPRGREKSLRKLIANLTEDQQNFLRKEVYRRFFILAPAGQDFFKQSTTRLYWIADKVVEMTVEMYKDPREMVEIISAVGLRHVGYGVSNDFFAPYVSGAVETMRELTSDARAEDGFRWSLSLIARMMARTVQEGSTIVMKAINTNSAKALKKAVSCAPRSKRALWMLNITVGTQSISPLYWAIESGSLQTANAMIRDLLTIRADRDNYYYGCDDLFTRHPDIIKRLCGEASGLLPTLLNGLIWRSRVTVRGERRVNYYVKHLIVDLDGNFSTNLEWLVDHEDPKIICHPVVVLFSDLLWDRVASKYFLARKMWLFMTLVLFTVSQSILQHVNERQEPSWQRYLVFFCRLYQYVGSLLPIIVLQAKALRDDIRAKSFAKLGPFVFPEYLIDWNARTSFFLMLTLLMMLVTEPIFYCLLHDKGDFPGAGLFTQHCPEAMSKKQAYSTISMCAMLIYWMQITDLSIFATRISAFVLVCLRVLPELGLFILAVASLIVCFSTCASALDHQDGNFNTIPDGMLTFLKTSLGMFPRLYFDEVFADPILAIAFCVFVIAVLIFLIRLLVAQLILAYEEVYDDMVGYARLNRGSVICETMLYVSTKQWSKLVERLRFNDKLEFNEGDIGLAGGIQVTEPANLHPTTVDMIRRFGGSTSPMNLWPAEHDAHLDEDENKLEKLEKLVLRFCKAVEAGGGGGKKGKSGGESRVGSSVASDDSDE